ncbi:unnamed protein product [Cylindrotheca closterium]|uniref:Uncharacterized protein n=1 Tax=Cylindrotheca closterium TaxID=2856 RepID=A0AAD2CPV5_9STRA|nr:unnamed protein product [Cylindrotheca closterium]
MSDERTPSWMDDKNDESHSLMFDDEESGKESSPSKDSAYGATTQDNNTDDGEGKSVISHITTEDTATARTAGGTLEGPRKNIVLYVFHWIEAFAICCCVALMITQVFPLFFIPLDKINPGAIVLKIYISIFCGVFILVEYDAAVPFLKDSQILQNYLSRGFVYSFLGVSALEEAYSERVQDTVGHQKDEFHVAWLGVFMQVTAWLMFGVGLLYMVLGVCCMKRLRDKLQRDDRQKWKDFREAKKLLRQQGL